jgi:transposase
VCRLHRLIRELVPGGTPRALTAQRAEALVNGLKVSDTAAMMRVELALDHIDDMKRFDLRIDQITLKIHAAVKDSGTTLTRIYGVGPLTAGLILGEVGDVSRFPTRTTSPATPAQPPSQCHQATTTDTDCHDQATGN